MNLDLLIFELIDIIKDFIIFKPLNNLILRNAVNLWCINKNNSIIEFGHISNWNISLINDLSYLFFKKFNFNDNIIYWNTSNVINMNYMFKQAYIFDKPLNNWNTSNVTNVIIWERSVLQNREDLL